MADDYSPIYCGDTGASLATVFQKKDGTAYDLTGATISMVMLLSGTSTSKTGVGTWTIDNAIDGEAHYQYGEDDVDTAGTWILYIKITKNIGIVHADTKTLVILPVP